MLIGSLLVSYWEKLALNGSFFLYLGYYLQFPPANERRRQVADEILEPCWPMGSQETSTKYKPSTFLSQPGSTLTTKHICFNKCLTMPRALHRPRSICASHQNSIHPVRQSLYSFLTFLRLIFYYLFAGERQKRQADFYSTRIFDGVPIVVRGEYTEQTLTLFLTLCIIL